MLAAESLAVVAAGVFFLCGLLMGCWKYYQIHTRSNGRAHPYVDLGHRASLLYAFAAMLLARFAEISQLPVWIEHSAMLAVLFYFASAIVSYIWHGWREDTLNQFKPESGKTAVLVFMISLALVEVGGFLVLFYGVLQALVSGAGTVVGG